MANIDETNFRSTAQDIIKAYVKKGMILDALLWGRVIGLYDAALDKARLLAMPEPSTTTRSQ